METIEAFEEELEREVTSTAQHHILYAKEDAKLLDENKNEFSQCDREKNTYSEMRTPWSGNIGVFSEDEGHQNQCIQWGKVKDRSHKREKYNKI